MDPLVLYAIPVSGLRDGTHHFRFQIGKEFFQEFEDSAIQDGTLLVELELDKRPSMYVLDFVISGHIHTECDRCLEPMVLPLEDEHQLLIKFDAIDPREEAEVVYLEPGLQQLQIAKYIYEFIHLSVPITKTCEMGDGACSDEVLDILDGYAPAGNVSDPEEEGPSPWEALKNLDEE